MYELGEGVKFAISLVPNLGLYFGYIKIWYKETDGSEGMSWSQVFTPIVPSDNFTLGHVWISHLLISFIFIIILWYVDNVRPGKFGVAQPLIFPFTVSIVLKLFLNYKICILRSLTGVENPRLILNHRRLKSQE